MRFETAIATATAALEEFGDPEHDGYGIGVGRHNPHWVAFAEAIELARRVACDETDVHAVEELLVHANEVRAEHDERIHCARETLAEISEAING